MDYNKIKSIIEGLLFVVGDEGIEAKQIASIIQIDVRTVIDLIDDMQGDYKRENRGIQIVQFGAAYQLTTLPEHALYFERLVSSSTHSTLSQAALETLAIIAYKQPITKVEIEEIRGVRSERAINKLISRELIKEAGRLETVGRPILYGTTKEFLDYFGLKSLDELPSPPDFSKLEEEESLLLFRYDE